MNKLDKSNLEKNFRQWMIGKGKAKQELTDVFINNNGNIHTEKRMAWIIDVTPNDYKEFCDESNIDYEEMILLAMYEKIKKEGRI